MHSNIHAMIPTPDEVYAEWNTPAKDLPPVCWMYFSRLLNRWRACHGPCEAAWRFVRGDQVRLIDELPPEVMGVWTGWVVEGVIDPSRFHKPTNNLA